MSGFPGALVTSSACSMLQQGSDDICLVSVAGLNSELTEAARSRSQPQLPPTHSGRATGTVHRARYQAMSLVTIIMTHMTHRKHRIPVIISLNTQLNLLIYNRIKSNVIDNSSRMPLWLDAKFQREYKLISPVSPLSVLSNFAGGSFRSDSLLVSLNRFLFGKFWKNVFL